MTLLVKYFVKIRKCRTKLGFMVKITAHKFGKRSSFAFTKAEKQKTHQNLAFSKYRLDDISCR